MKDMALILFIARILVLIGGINWGLVGLLGLDIVSVIFGTILARLIFIIVGVAAGFIIYQMYLEKKGKA